MKTIIEKKQDCGNNESIILHGIYLTRDNEYMWLTPTRSGFCKKLATAKKKLGI